MPEDNQPVSPQPTPPATQPVGNLVNRGKILQPVSDMSEYVKQQAPPQSVQPSSISPPPTPNNVSNQARPTTTNSVYPEPKSYQNPTIADSADQSVDANTQHTASIFPAQGAQPPAASAFNTLPSATPQTGDGYTSDSSIQCR